MTVLSSHSLIGSNHSVQGTKGRTVMNFGVPVSFCFDLCVEKFPPFEFFESSVSSNLWVHVLRFLRSGTRSGSKV